jgi:hypothetical protein
MDEHFAPSVHGVMPWNVAHENMYDTHNMRGAPPTYAQVHFPAPVHTNESVAQWKAHREQTLREWGQKRESQMHRMPSCLMDQMMSGSGLFPIRHIDEQEWLTPEEIGMVTSLEAVLQRTGHGRNLALDMLTPRIYNLNVKIILDNSGSMGLDMMGEQTNTGPTNTWIDKTCSYISVTNQNGNPNRYYDIDQVPHSCTPLLYPTLHMHYIQVPHSSHAFPNSSHCSIRTCIYSAMLVTALRLSVMLVE